MLVALTSADGTACYVNPANVVSLTRVPMELSPTQATTYVNDCDQAARLVVVGTPADIAAALDAGGVEGAPCVSRGFVDGATGNVTMVSGVSCVGLRTGAGRYTISIDPAVTIEAPTLALTLTEAGIISQNGPAGATFGVATEAPGGGAAEDHGFTFHVFGTIQE